jgi:HEAT repeat protein
LLLIAGSAVFIVTNRGQLTPLAERGIEDLCRIPAGNSLNYHVHAAADMAFSLQAVIGLGANSTMQQTHELLKGELRLRSKSNLAQASILEARFDESAGSRHPFQFTLKDNCQIESFLFASSVSQETRNQLVNLLTELQIVLPAIKQQTNWKATSKDSLGEYTARYHSNSQPNADTKIERQKEHYLKTHQPSPDINLQAKIVTSKAQLQFAPRQYWLLKGTIDEEIELGTDKGRLARVHFKASIEQSDVEKNQLPFDSLLLDGFETYQQSDNRLQSTGHLRGANRAPQSISSNLGDALNDFESLLEAKSTGSKRAALEYLVDHLRNQPESASELVNALKNDKIKEQSRSMVFLALETTGHNEAQLALQEVLSGEDFTDNDRMRAAIALQDVEAPSTSTINLLTEMAHRVSEVSENDSNYNVIRTATLSLGTLIHNSWEHDPLTAQKLQSQLIHSLAQSDSAETTSLLINAIGNTSDPLMETEVRNYLNHSSELVRSAAASALGQLGGPNAESLIIDRLSNEESSTVRKELLSSLGGIDSVAPSTLEHLSSALQSEPQASVRIEIVKVLSAHEGHDPKVRDKLISHLRSETDTRVVRQIARYLK